MRVVIADGVVDLILKLLIPVAVALVTKYRAPDAVKAIVNIVLAGVTTLLSQNLVDNGPAIISGDTLMNWAITLALSIAMYLGLFKPVAKVDQTVLPNQGIG